MNHRLSSKPKGRGLSKPPTPPAERFEAWIYVRGGEQCSGFFGSVDEAKRWLIPQLNDELPTIEDEWGICDRWSHQLVLASAGVKGRCEDGYGIEEDDERS